MKRIFNICLLGLFLTNWLISVQATPIKSQPPRVFIWKADLLAQTKQAIKQNDPDIMPAVNSLRTAANKAVAGGSVYSVVNKPMLPPSGDKHDYMSMGTYWWPNPNTANGLPYVKLDGETNPEIKRLKNDKDLNNLIRDVENTALAYYFFEDEKYAQKAADLLRTWFLAKNTYMNPNLNFGQAIPGLTQGRGIGIIDTRNLPIIIDAIGLLQGSNHWSAADQQGMQDWISQYLNWLLESKNGKNATKEKNNHGTWYDVQTASYALFVNKKPLAEKILRTALTKRLATQITPDGRQPHELSRKDSWTYSIMNLKGFLALAALSENVGLDIWEYKTSDGRGIRQALDYLVPFASGEKKWEKVQMKAFKPTYLYPILLQAAHKYPEADYAQIADRIANKAMLNNKCNLTWPVL